MPGNSIPCGPSHLFRFKIFPRVHRLGEPGIYDRALLGNVVRWFRFKINHRYTVIFSMEGTCGIKFWWDFPSGFLKHLSRLAKALSSSQENFAQIFHSTMSIEHKTHNSSIRIFWRDWVWGIYHHLTPPTKVIFSIVVDFWTNHVFGNHILSTLPFEVFMLLFMGSPDL